MAVSWHINGPTPGVTNYLLDGLILQGRVSVIVSSSQVYFITFLKQNAMQVLQE